MYTLIKLGARLFAPSTILSARQVAAAASHVRRELRALGLFTRGMRDVAVRLTEEISMYFGYWDGDICIPDVSASRLGEVFRRDAVISLRDVIRHEYGHAFADYNRRRIDTRGFERAFYRPYDSRVSHYTCEPSDFVSTYAQDRAREDFAETFAEFVWRKGRIPGRWLGCDVERKWAFISRLQDKSIM